MPPKPPASPPSHGSVDQRRSPIDGFSVSLLKEHTSLNGDPRGEKESDADGRRMSRRQGLTLAHFRAQLEALRDTSLTLELNLSTFGQHPPIHLGHQGDNVS